MRKEKIIDHDCLLAGPADDFTKKLTVEYKAPSTQKILSPISLPMFRLRSIINALILLLVIFATIFGLRWYDGYQKTRQENPNISFSDYVRFDITSMQKSMKELVGIVKEASESVDAIKKGSVNKIAQALDLYFEDKRMYPNDLSELIGDYIDPKSKVLDLEGLFYQKTFSGYELGISLKNGETYSIRK